MASTSDSESDTCETLDDIICIRDLESLAKKRLEKSVFRFIHCGADEENTRRWNRERIVDRYYLKPRILRDVSSVNLTMYIYGDKVSMPVGISPTGLHRMMHPDGELATVRAANRHNALMILSQFSTTSLEDVAKEAPICTKWQNIYLLKDKLQTQSIINRAIRYGYRALVVTCDSPVIGYRRKLIRSEPEFKKYELKNFSSDQNLVDNISDHAHDVLDPSSCWQDLADIKKMVGDTIRVIVKGVMTPEDAEEALKIGVDGIYISNHGGRQLDCCQSTIEALPAIVKVVKKRCPIFIDGGFQTGNDILKALAIGADMVFIGRPILFGLGIKGEEGVLLAFKLLEAELKRTMAFCGCTKLSDIDSNIIIERT